MDLPTEALLLYGIIVFIIFENVIEIYLSSRQVKVFKTVNKVPKELDDSMNTETFEKARIYGLDKEQFSIFKTIIMDVIIVSLELYFGFIAKIWIRSQQISQDFGWDHKNELVVSCVFLFLMNVISTMKDLPFKIYSSFVLEEKHGFNKQTGLFFVWDQLKGFIIGQIISVPIAVAIILIVQKGGNYFFIWLWLFTTIVTLVLVTIYPILIAPLFDKFRPLEEGPLRQSIENLTVKLKFSLAQVYVVEGSKRSAHSNAYFYGLWYSKRIVLFDTLLMNKGETDVTKLKPDEIGKGCSDSEILAVLGHELGHWKLGHITKNIIIMQIHLFLMFAVFGYLFKYEPFYQALGFYDEQPVLIGLLMIFTYILAPYNAIISFGMTILSRTFEYQADAFAQKLGFTKDLCKALIKLHIDNLGFPVYDWMYSSWNHSHPTLLQRIDRLVNTKQKTN